MFMLADTSITIMMSMPPTERSVRMKLCCGLASATSRSAMPATRSATDRGTGLRVAPAAAARGRLRGPGDKSVSHRALMLGGIVSGVVLSWVTVASELSATVVLYSGPWRTLTVVMFQALEGGGAGVATAAASTLIVVTLVPVALLHRLVRRYELA